MTDRFHSAFTAGVQELAGSPDYADERPGLGFLLQDGPYVTPLAAALELGLYGGAPDDATEGYSQFEWQGRKHTLPNRHRVGELRYTLYFVHEALDDDEMMRPAPVEPVYHYRPARETPLVVDGVRYGSRGGHCEAPMLTLRRDQPGDGDPQIYSLPPLTDEQLDEWVANHTIDGNYAP